MNSSLYIKIRKKVYEDHQILDRPTLMWIKKKQKTTAVSIYDVKKEFKPLAMDDFFAVASTEELFENVTRLKSIHGLAHALRTIIFTHIICSILDVKNHRKFLFAAGIHDVLRINDKKDVDHGARAAEWLKKNKVVSKQFASNDLVEICYGVRYHDVALESIPEDVKNEFGLIIKVLKSADALERYRLPKQQWWPKKELVPLDLPSELYELAKKFIQLTEQEILVNQRKPLDSILLVALKLKLVK